MKLKASKQSDNFGYSFSCPGCNTNHRIPVDGPNAWEFNGSLERPSFKPSILVTGRSWVPEDDEGEKFNGNKMKIADTICHSYITDGKIQFLSDCTHRFANQIFELPNVIEEVEK